MDALNVNKYNLMKSSLWNINHVLSSVGWILINKVIMEPPFNFKYVFTLSSIHFFVTAVIMELMALTKLFVPYRDSKWSASLLTSIICALSAGLMNLSLRMNSLDFYELFKLFGIPCLVFMQMFVYKKPPSCVVIIPLFMILMGIILAVMKYAQSNLFSCLVALTAVLITTQSQIWDNRKQLEDHLDPIQIIHSRALPSFFACAMLAVLLEFTSFNEDMNILSHSWTFIEIKWILLSAAVTALVNLCWYGLTEDTSAIPIQLARYFPTVLILIASYYLYYDNAHTEWNNLLGIAIALCGNVFYDYLCHIKAHSQNLNDSFSTTVLKKFFRNSMDQPNEMNDLLLDSNRIQISPIY